MSWFFCFFAGQWLKHKGDIPEFENGPYLYLFNHESMFDQFMVGAYLRHYTTALNAKEEMRYPIWGTLARKYGIVGIERKNLKQAIKSLEEVEVGIKHNISFLISPEGTRTKDGSIGKFKKGPFHVAKNTGVKIIPIGLIGAFRAKRKTDWKLSPGLLTVKFGAPIKVSHYKNLTVDELKLYVREKIIDLTIKNKGEKQ